jgi:hypothetical protein
MTDKEVMQMALDALEYAADNIGCPNDDDIIGVARKELRAALAQPEKEWVGLTDDEILKLFNVNGTADSDRNARILLEDAHKLLDAVKEKNT